MKGITNAQTIKITVSTEQPSGGAPGDLWFTYEE